jgi:hypothetical protein
MERAEYLDLMDKALDLSFLQTRMIPGLDLCRGSSWPSKRKDLKEVCLLHGARLRVLRKMPEDDVLGLYDDRLSLITMCGTPTLAGNEISDHSLLTVFTHELAHALQYSIFRSIPTRVYRGYFRQFHNELRLEQTAEQTAFFIALNYFPTLCRKLRIKRSWFDAYTTPGEILFIAKRYGYDPKSSEVLSELKKLSNKV